MIFVSDPEEPRIGPYRDVRERDLVGRENQFIAEGEVVLRVLLGQRRHGIRSLLIAEKRIAALEPLLAEVPEGVPVYAASQSVLDRIAGFPLHRGILALGERAPEPDLPPLLGRGSLVVVLMGIANHDNIGGIFRNAAAFGADAVLLDTSCCDPLYRKAIRVSVGGVLRIPFARLPQGADPVALCAEAGYEILSLSPAGTERLADLEPAPRTALILGAEGPGLPREILERTRSVGIPMAGGFDSLNVATTSGIVLHHLSAKRR